MTVLNMVWTQNAAIKLLIGIVRHDVEHTRITVKLAKFCVHIAAEYLCKSSGKSDVFVQSKLTGMFPNKCDTDGQPEIAS